MTDSPPFEWNIRDEDDGWVLRIRYAVPMRELIPYFRRQWLLVEAVAFVCSAALSISLVSGSRPQDAVGLATQMFMVFFGALSLAYWIRVARMGWYFSANRVVHVKAHAAKFETQDGVFDLECLRSMRIEEAGAHPGRRLLVFHSHTMEAAPLIGWPGVTPATAEIVAERLSARLGK